MKIIQLLRKKAVILLMFFLIFSISLAAQDDAENMTGQDAPFVRELALRLQDRGWSEENIAALVAAARELDWSGISVDNADVAAFALDHGFDDIEDQDSIEINGLVQAKTALELALSAMELEELGYEERAVARAALTGVKGMLSVIEEWKKSGQQENLGLLIRNQVREQVFTAVKQRESADDKRRGPESVDRRPGGGFNEGKPPVSADNPWRP